MRKVILDVDTGVDDAVGIMLAVSSPDIEVLAITCVAGNTSIDNACRNTARVLQHCNKRIRIYKGACKSLLETKDLLDPCRYVYHGDDGLGKTDWPDDVDESVIESEHAVQAMIRIIRKHSGEVSLITFGPLTNVALAFSLDCDLSDHLKDIYIMGGNTNGSGVDLIKEFNFGVDPEAAYITMNNMAGKIVISSRDVSDIAPFSKEWSSETLRANPSSNSSFINKMIKYRLDGDDFENIRLPDFMLIASFVYSEVVTERKDACAKVILAGESRSLLNIQWETDTPNANFYMNLSLDRLKEIFQQLLMD